MSDHVNGPRERVDGSRRVALQYKVMKRTFQVVGLDHSDPVVRHTAFTRLTDGGR